MNDGQRAAPVLILEEFLAPQELTWVWNFAMSRADRFISSHVVGDGYDDVLDTSYRRSRLLFELEGIHDLLASRIAAYFPYVCHRLSYPSFDVTSVEVQLTASNDSEFFRAHTDSGHGSVREREITFVYFCHREPRGFSGGELRVYDSDPPVGSGCVIRPEQNRMVFFPSNRWHEIAPVSCPSNNFADSRLTLNGWLHR
jgi:SM-20-related protein